MEFSLKTLSLEASAKEKSDTLIVLISKDFVAVDGTLNKFITETINSGDLNSTHGNLQCYQSQFATARTLVLVPLENITASTIGSSLARAYEQIKTTKPKKVVVYFSFDISDEILSTSVHAVADASYVFTTTKPTAEARTVEKIIFSASNAKDNKTYFDQIIATVSGVEFAKEWANRPANHATPTLLANAAKTLAKESGFTCEVLDQKEVEKRGMGAFVSVAKGSSEPLKFIILRYSGANENEAPIALIGKGVTFDSGGISIKTAANMDEMKFDMGGAASVLGTFKALSIIKPIINVVGLIPACENMPGPSANKPGDVVTSMDGKTIEILNTDAEGRLLLCDAITYAQQKIKPELIIDMATLTGACIVALGHLRSALYCNNEALASDILASSDATQDLCWRMPLDEEYVKVFKSNFADIANSADRAAGSITAAKFLQAFVHDTPWAHLDIAGSAWRSGGKNKGATGRPVILLVDYLCKKAKKSLSAADTNNKLLVKSSPLIKIKKSKKV
jgi:leucyl aminopeptidase